MSRSPGGRVGTGDNGAVFLLIAAPEPTPRANSRPPVEVFTSEGVAREAFVRRRLEVGSGSAWTVAALALVMAAVGWVSAGISDRAIGGPARHSFEMQDVDAGGTSMVLPAHPGRSR